MPQIRRILQERAGLSASDIERLTVTNPARAIGVATT
jgi:hypothetical protein